MDDALAPSIKVLHLIDSGGLYGAEKVLLTLCSEQMKQGLQPTILSCGIPGEESKAIESEAERLGIPCKAWRMNAGLNIKGMREIWEYIHSQGFTHLHSHGYKFNILLALTRQLGKQQKLISTLHGYTATSWSSKAGILQLLDRYLLSVFDSVVWVGEREALSPFFRFIHKSRLQCVANGVIFFDPLESRDYEKLTRLLIVGRLSREKGHRYALEALSELISLGFDVELVIAGSGPLKGELVELAKNLGVVQNVEFLGFVDDMGTLYRSCDLLLMPSLTEGLPLTLLEAVGCGLPSLATRVGAIQHVLRSDLFLIGATSSKEAIVESYRRIYSFRGNQLKGIMQLLMNRTRDEYGSTIMSQRYKAIYEGHLID